MDCYSIWDCKSLVSSSGEHRANSPIASGVSSEISEARGDRALQFVAATPGRPRDAGESASFSEARRFGPAPFDYLMDVHP